MINMKRFAMSRGRTVKEILDQAWKSVHGEVCCNGTTRLDANRICENAFYIPSYVADWLVKTRATPIT